MVLQVLVRMG